MVTLAASFNKFYIKLYVDHFYMSKETESCLIYKLTNALPTEQLIDTFLHTKKYPALVYGMVISV